VLPEVASLLPEDEVDPLDELEPLDEPLEVVELDEPVLLELDVLPAVGVDEEVVSVSVEVPESELVLVLELELFVEEDVPPLTLLCAALGTVAATASDPAMPLAATIAVIVAVRRLPCRTERAAPSASMDILRQGMLSIRDPKDASAG
jgi:hypothetical protein